MVKQYENYIAKLQFLFTDWERTIQPPCKRMQFERKKTEIDLLIVTARGFKI